MQLAFMEVACDAVSLFQASDLAVRVGWDQRMEKQMGTGRKDLVDEGMDLGSHLNPTRAGPPL
jgi:hypothetical protein